MLYWKLGEFLTQNPGTSGSGNCLVTLLYWEDFRNEFDRNICSGDIQLVGPGARNWTQDFWTSYCDLSKPSHKLAEIGYDLDLMQFCGSRTPEDDIARHLFQHVWTPGIHEKHRKTRFTSTPPRQVAQKAHVFSLFQSFPVCFFLNLLSSFRASEPTLNVPDKWFSKNKTLLCYYTRFFHWSSQCFIGIIQSFHSFEPWNLHVTKQNKMTCWRVSLQKTPWKVSWGLT